MHSFMKTGYLTHWETIFGHEACVTLQACFLSLPVALLLWAVATFMIAISAYGIQQGGLSTRRVTIAVLSTLVVIASGTLAYFSKIWYEKEPYLDDPEDDEDVHSSGGPLKLVKAVVLGQTRKAKEWAKGASRRLSGIFRRTGPLSIQMSNRPSTNAV